MIYMVQHTFALPELEEEWNTWYFAYLDVLMSLPGFRSAQRFRVPESKPPRYMAMYTVAGPEVFESTTYRDAGGGGSRSVRFRPAYQSWVRNLLADIDQAPAVREGQFLVSVDASEARADVPGVDLQWGRAIALHRTTPLRGLAVVDDATAQSVKDLPGVTVYEPYGQRLPATQ